MAVINSYEAVIVISLKLGEEGIAETIAKFKDMVSKNGTLENVDEWGKRRLAQFPAEFDRVLMITDGVLRSMIIKKEA